jgi:ABC-2 type transport system permease protein
MNITYRKPSDFLSSAKINEMEKISCFVTKNFITFFSGQTLDVHPWDAHRQIMFGFAITNEINNVNIAILDKSKDTETK